MIAPAGESTTTAPAITTRTGGTPTDAEREACAWQGDHPELLIEPYLLCDCVRVFLHELLSETRAHTTSATIARMCYAMQRL